MITFFVVAFVVALAVACVTDPIGLGGPPPFPSAPAGGLPFSRGGSGMRLPGSLAPIQPGGGAGGCGCEGGGGGAGRCFPSAFAPLPMPRIPCEPPTPTRR